MHKRIIANFDKAPKAHHWLRRLLGRGQRRHHQYYKTY
jgi:hypothetical protein